MKTNRLSAALAVIAVAGFMACNKTGPQVTSVTVTPDRLTLKVGETGQLTAEILPADAQQGQAVEWTSDNPDVAGVSTEGLVTATGGGTAVITASCSGKSATCTVTVSAEPVTGDYYYSDGTWSTEHDPGKEVIGIVFWTGNPSDEDPTLARDFPGCTNGLAVAISGDETSAWQSQSSSYGSTVWAWAEANTEGFVNGMCEDAYSADDNLNKKLGYNNTKVAEAFNEGAGNGPWPVDAVEKAVAYREAVPAPETSSDWYLPSAKELSLLCSGQTEDENIYDIYGVTDIVEIVNERLSAIGAEPMILDGGYYWSSTESGNSYAVEISFSSGSVDDMGTKSSDSERVRFILAF